MGRKKILIIEDDNDTRQGLSIRIQSLGYETATAVDAYSGLSTAQKAAPDLIILDLGLPAGDGIKLLKQLKLQSATATIPVIVLSGRDPLVNQPAALEAGAVAFLQKPAETQVLTQLIEQQIGPGNPGGGAENRKAKILVVEDDDDTRQGLVMRLNAKGFVGMSVSDAPSVFRMLQRDKPDLILLDLGLPAGDGFSVLEKLKGNTLFENIPVIVLSARDPAVNKPKALQMGAVAFLQKPADGEDLLSEIARALGREKSVTN